MPFGGERGITMNGSADLPHRLLEFSDALRSRDIVIGTGNILTALKGLSFIDIREKADFYHTLKASLVTHHEHAVIFDETFEKFWSFSEKRPSMNELPTKMDGSQKPEKDKTPKVFEEEGVRLRELTGDHATAQEDDMSIPAYSPREILQRKDFSSMQANELEEMKRYITALYRKLALVISRRWKKGNVRDRIDLRRTMRHSVRHGGEFIDLKWKQQKPKPVRIVLLCDVSGSMNVYGQFLLLLMYVMQNVYRFCDTLAFSTRLTRISQILRKAETFDDVLQYLSHEMLDWSGGTNIGGALRELRQRYSPMLRSGNTIFLLFSDGWERGDAALLSKEMKHLKQHTKKLIWLNPHLGSPNYQPLCKGMAAALPYLDYFLPCHNFSSLKHLGNLISRM